MARPRKPAGSTKGDSLTIRIRPRVKFGLELLARMQRRSISDVVETLVIKGATDAFVQLTPPDGDSEIPTNLIDQLWAPTEAERLVNMAELLPDLMNYEEELRWKLIWNTDLLWHYLPGVLDGKLLRLRDMGLGHSLWVPNGYTPPSWKQYGDAVVSDKEANAEFSFLDMDLLEKAWPDIIRCAGDEISERQLCEIIQGLLPSNPVTPTASGH